MRQIPPDLDIEPFLAPEPEGPEEISARMLRLRRSRASAARERLSKVIGLEGLSPVKAAALTGFAVAEVALISLSVFTDLSIPLEWLATPALTLLTLLFDRDEKQSDKPHQMNGPRSNPKTLR